ncbi:DUF6188 family protein [Curtobacterium herbarum]|uniref:Uncharacterized protein n=1 Tax=Curtobacterium herbarum TaxID=150122 RepID=A0ABP4KA22_9MICO|nr:DUF6188 family protein [Curtobacterium herbarum]MBM7475581.1 hypothetical protein [Curtobacterium herbarum]MCS6543495.1 DUF6188 family protein [Curtobacterium herbarum]
MNDDHGLEFTDARVDVLTVSFQTTIGFSNGTTMQFEAEFAITGPDGERRLVDPGQKASLAPVLALLGDTVRNATLDGADLRLDFASGTVLQAWPDESYESWNYRGAGPERRMIIAMPGGGLAVVDPPATSD